MHAQLKKDDASLQNKSSNRHQESSSNIDQNSDLLSGETTGGFDSSPGYPLPPPGQGPLVMQCKGLADSPEPTKISDQLIQRRVNNTGLPDNLKNGIENLSGYSMDDVKVHYNSSKPANLRAHAYTQGTAIHVAPGQEQHLPHEAWHVVQQKQGRVKPTLQMKGKMNVNDDAGLEREADMMGAKAVSLSPHNSLLKTEKSSLRHSHFQMKTIQRFSNDERPYEHGYEPITHSNMWFRTAEAYERRLGAYCAQHPRANEALTLGIDKLIWVVSQHYGEELAPGGELNEDLLKEVFFRDDKKSSGQVGLNLSVEKMYKVLLQGNLRERMTAFYNAAYFGSGYGNNIKRGFKRILHNIIFDSKDDLKDHLIDSLRLNKEKINEQVVFYNNYYTRGVFRIGLEYGAWVKTGMGNIYRRMRGQQTVEDKSNTFSKDVFALGNLSFQAGDRSVYNSQYNKYDRPRPVNAKPGLITTPDDAAVAGVPLSDEELAFLYDDEEVTVRPKKRFHRLRKILNPRKRKQSTPSEQLRDQTRQRPLPWEPGHYLFEIDPDDSWYQKIHDQLKIPVVAGVSGTTTRMLKAFQFLNVSADDLDFRLALMGWMLPTWDHSLYEILRGSHISGVKGDNEDNTIKDVIRMYMNIAPLSSEELRDNVARDHMFPHEEVYATLTNLGVPGAPINTEITDNPLFNQEEEQFLAPSLPVIRHIPREGLNSIGKNEFRNVSRAHVIAIAAYTSSLHSLLNPTIRANSGFLGFGRQNAANAWNQANNAASEADREAARNNIPFNLANLPAKAGEKLTKYKDVGFGLVKGGAAASYDQTAKNSIKINLRENVTKFVNRVRGIECHQILKPIENILYELRNNNPRTPHTMDDVYRWIDEFVEVIYPEMKMHINMAIQGLNNLPPSHEKVFTGQWYTSPISVRGNEFDTATYNPFSWKEGNTIEISEFMSTSTDWNIAMEFAVREGGNDFYKKPLFVEIDLKGFRGRDISMFSVQPQEKEVLLLPGTKFRITGERTQKMTRQNDGEEFKLKVLKAVEVE